MKNMILSLMMIGSSVSSVCLAATPEEVARSAMEGYALFVRDSLPDDREKGYGMMLSAAWEGDAKAANNIGWLMANGEFVEKDLKGALRWFERAADQGLPAAALNYVELIMQNKDEALGQRLPDVRRMAKASWLAGSALAMGRGLPYDPKKGERLILQAGLLGDESAAMAIAQQLEMYPDSFSYLPIQEIVAECDTLLPLDAENVKDGVSSECLSELILTPGFWWKRAGEDKENLIH